MTGNPWFWGGLTRWEFERALVKDAVYLKEGKPKVAIKKYDIEAVKARKNALTATGVNVAAINGVMTDEVKAHNIAMMVAPRKIK